MLQPSRTCLNNLNHFKLRQIIWKHLQHFTTGFNTFRTECVFRVVFVVRHRQLATCNWGGNCPCNLHWQLESVWGCDCEWCEREWLAPTWLRVCILDMFALWFIIFTICSEAIPNGIEFELRQTISNMCTRIQTRHFKWIQTKSNNFGQC